MESSAIYGLETQGRTLCSANGEGVTDTIRFYVGTLCPRTQGQIHQIDYDEETNRISRKIFKPGVGEIWQIQCCPSDSNLIACVYNHITEANAELKCGIWKLPIDSTPDENVRFVQNLDFVKEPETLKAMDWHPTKPDLISEISTSGFYTYNLKKQTMEAKFSLSENVRLDYGKWSPHLDGNQFGIIANADITGVDYRTMKKVWEIKRAHKFKIRDIDFNPNKQYYMASSGDDCTARFWDIRNTEKYLKEVGGHTHWIWKVKFNTFHDQLVITAGSDSRVVLHSVPSISSEPKGHMLFSDAENEDEITQNLKNSQLEEGVLAKYEEHEDAVYAAEWSAFDPWIFASLSYDGRLVINKVPQSLKYKILL